MGTHCDCHMTKRSRKPSPSLRKKYSRWFDVSFRPLWNSTEELAARLSSYTVSISALSPSSCSRASWLEKTLAWFCHIYFEFDMKHIYYLYLCWMRVCIFNICSHLTCKDLLSAVYTLTEPFISLSHYTRQYSSLLSSGINWSGFTYSWFPGTYQC